MSCQQKFDEMVKNYIYKNKVVIFGYSEDEYTIKVDNFFKKEFEYFNPNSLIFLDKIANGKELSYCLEKRTKGNKIPIVYLNGMYIGGWRSVENMHYRRDFDIFF